MSSHRSVFMDYLLMSAGTACMAVAIGSLYDPMNLVTGGFTGISIMVKRLTRDLTGGGIPLWFTNLILNIPLFAAAIRMKGLRFMRRTIFSTVAVSVWLYILPPMDLAAGDILVAAVLGGLFTGLGIGLVLLARGTTGGVDLLALLIRTKLRHYSVVQIMAAIDGLIILSGVALYGVRPALYALIAIAIVTKISDFIVEGWKFSKVAYIITEKERAVADAVMEGLCRGITGLSAVGMYSGRERRMLFCAVSKKEVVTLKDIVAEKDPDAFVIVADAVEVLGEGFLEMGEGR